PPLAPVAAWVTNASLAGCDGLVAWAASWPVGCVFVPALPEWWLWVFYPAVLAMLMLQSLRRIWNWCVLAVAVWVTVGLGSGAARPTPNELRCTFPAGGHGGWVVIETPDGRPLVYDAGSIGGPEVTRRHIAPFLWQRGIRRIDELFLSHADLDHFNGLVALLERFPVGQVSCTPTFRERPTAAVRRTIQELESRGIPICVLSS